MAQYHFVTDIRVATSPDEVWNALEDPTTWPQWWRELRRAELTAPGRPDGVGRRYRLSVRTALPYTLSFDSETTRISRPSLWEARVRGELEGTGLYEVFPVEGGSGVRHTWIVATTRRWMNALAPVARPVFAWNHAVLMRDFATGLAGRLGVPLLSSSDRVVAPGSPEFGRLSPSAMS
jgi:uncharacterized protein YndB with AHSA1/START domain